MIRHIKDEGNSMLCNKIFSIESSKLCSSLVPEERNQERLLTLLVNNKVLHEKSLLLINTAHPFSCRFSYIILVIANFRSLDVHCLL